MNASFSIVKKVLLILFVLTFTMSGYTQSGGNGTFDFLNLYNSPRNAALGSNFISVNDEDIQLSITNPALIGDYVHNKMSLSFVDYYAGINYGFAAYGRSFEKQGNFVASLQYMNSGKFLRTDAQGIEYGEFSVGEYAFNVGWGKKLSEEWTLGTSLKFIYSAFDEWNSMGAAADIAINYHNKEKLFSSSLILRNIGRQFTSYATEVEPLTFNIQLALSKKLSKGPFRFHLVLNNLNRWNLFYEDPYDPDYIADSFTNEISGKSKTEIFQENLLRHVIVGVEILPVKSFSVQVSYNYNQRKELGVSSKTGMTGFSAGFGFKINRFQFNYARSQYHIHSSPNMISIMTKL